MLSDPLTVKALDWNTASTIVVHSTSSFATTDLSPGKSVRVGALSSLSATPGTLTIAHSVSNENKPVKTDRTLIRIDGKFHNVAGQELNGFAYMVIGVPRGALLPDDEAPDWYRMVQTLVGVVAVSPTATTLSGSNLNRILAGEP